MSLHRQVGKLLADEDAAGVAVSLPKIPSGRIRVVTENQRIIASTLAILRLLAAFIASLFKSRRRLETETLFLRHQRD